MKKSLVLAMAMALGVTASAYAANPFSDVPAGHWAYDSVNKLVAEGVVDGYGDGTFGGDKLMTRYEMAQIVAKAMPKGANVDKLAAEFADELDSLGVRVANLEKKTDNVKITGQVRASYRDVDGDSKGYNGRVRTRLFLNGAVNEDWSYTGRFENNQYYTNESGDDNISLNWAYVSGPIGGVAVDAGRMDFVKGDVMDTRGDGVKLAYGKDVKVFGWAFKAASSDWINDTEYNGEVGFNYDSVKEEWNDTLLDDGDRVYVAGVETKLGAVGANVRYYNADNYNSNEIWEFAFDGEIAKDLKLRGSWYVGDMDSDAAYADGDINGYLVGLAYKGAKASQPGSWGLYADYMDRPLSTYLDPTMFAGGYGIYPTDVVNGDGYEGYHVGGNVTLAKNIVAGVKYVDVESREGSDDTQTLWSEVVFTF